MKMLGFPINSKLLVLRLSKFTRNIRCFCSSLEAKHIVYEKNGEPAKVLKMVSSNLPALDPDKILVKVLAASINPADVNMIQGVYPIKPQMPAIGGSEGVAEVVDIGSQIKQFKPGDWVIPRNSGWGTWRTHAVCPANEMVKIPNDIPVISAASLAVNPCTAYRMLRDFEVLKEGDVIMQNGANSMVGQAVIQIAAAQGIQTINIIRDRPDIEDLKDHLTTLGANHVVVEHNDEFDNVPMKHLIAHMPKPKLALNCVGGRSALTLLKYLDYRGTMVTYGGMSKRPIPVPAGPLIFKDVKLRGYWMTQWTKENGDSVEQKKMWDYLCDLVRSQKFVQPQAQLNSLENFTEAVERSMIPKLTLKQFFIMPQE